MNIHLIKEILFQIFAFLGGFGMFIYGMHVMSEGLQKTAGSKMKQMIHLLTSNRFLAVTIGAFVTAIVQSSSATTVMVVGFVNASLMNLSQAVGVIMGANIGTTMTSWIVSSSEWAAFLKPTKIAPLAIAIGAVMLFFSKSSKKKQVGEIIIGFGMIFIGMAFMKDAITPYRESEAFKNAFIVLGQNPFLGILAGTLVTAIIQSSSASVLILQTLAVIGLVPWNAAVFIILGQNIGTTVTAMLSSIGTNKTAKRAAVIHLLFNVVGSLFFAILAVVYFKVFNTDLGGVIITTTQISIFHTFFNITNTVLMFPFANTLVRLSKIIIPGEDRKVSGREVALRHLDDRILETPSFAVESAIQEVVYMGKYVEDSLDIATQAVITHDIKDIETVFSRERQVNQLEEMITDYLVKINNTAISDSQKETINNLFYTINDLERLADHAKNIAELSDYYVKNELIFSDEAITDLKEISGLVKDIVHKAIIVRESGDYRLINKIEDIEETIDLTEDRYREAHIKRLTKGKCQAQSSIAFLDIISHYERMSDHALKIAYYVKDELLTE